MNGLRGVLAAAVAVALAADTSDAGMNRESMQRDIRIMEGVLGELLYGPSEEGGLVWGRAPDVEGMYFDGYGVLFLVEQPPRALGKMKRGRVDAGRSSPDSVLARDTMEDTRERLTEFFADYASSLRQLPPSERVTVRIRGREGRGAIAKLIGAVPAVPKVAAAPAAAPAPHPEPRGPESVGEEREGGWEDYRKGMEEYRKGMDEFRKEMEKVKEQARRIEFRVDRAIPVQGLEATAVKGELDRAKAGAVHFRELPENPPGERSIRIMEGILEKALRTGNSDVSGFHLEGLGAVFFVSARPDGDWMWVSDALEALGGGDDDRPGKVEAERFQAELVGLVADYGSTLKGVGGSESIVVKVDFGSWGKRKGRPSGMMLRVKKGDVDRHAAGEMTIDGLRRAMRIEEM